MRITKIRTNESQICLCLLPRYYHSRDSKSMWLKNSKLGRITRPRLAISTKTRRFRKYSCMSLWKSSIYVHFRLLRFGLSSLKSVTSSYLLSDSSKNSTFILKNSVLDSRSSNSTSIFQFCDSASTRLRLQSFDIRLDDEPRVGTPLHRYLKNRQRMTYPLLNGLIFKYS